LKAAGVRYFAITDHDSVKGNAEAAELAERVASLAVFRVLDFLAVVFFAVVFFFAGVLVPMFIVTLDK
jgi:hypothetical protein